MSIQDTVECVSEANLRLLSLSVCVGKEGNVLFNDALDTFYLRLYGVGHCVGINVKK